MLHTWKQDLGRHVHVHALVAGGALDQTGRWIAPRRGFLFPVKALSKVFRAKFMAAFEARRGAGPLLDDAALRGQGWRELKQQLYRHDWVVYAKQPLGGPAQVLEYLGRYTHRVAISNERLLEVGAERVRLHVRDAARPGGRRVIELPSEVFIARFLQHILPTGYKRIRHYGLLGPAAKAAGLAAFAARWTRRRRPRSNRSRRSCGGWRRWNVGAVRAAEPAPSWLSMSSWRLTRNHGRRGGRHDCRAALPTWRCMAEPSRDWSGTRSRLSRKSWRGRINTGVSHRPIYPIWGMPSPHPGTRAKK